MFSSSGPTRRGGFGRDRAGDETASGGCERPAHDRAGARRCRDHHKLGRAAGDASASCVDRARLAYTDLAPRLAFWEGAEKLSHEARRTGARILLGAGLSPGISNMMARQLAEAIGQIERIETAILLSVGDEYGPDSLNHVLESLTPPAGRDP